MQIVIDIPDDKWESYQPYKGLPYDNIMDNSVRYIADGTPLPKGHGRLIDADVLGEKLHRYTEAPYQYALAVFNDAPSIIESDKEASDG